MLQSFKPTRQYLAETEDAARQLLEAERDTLVEIERCRRQGLQLVAVAWLRAELVRRCGQARVQRLSERMRTAAMLRQQELSRRSEALAGDPGADASVLLRLDTAIDRVIEELVGIVEPS